MKIIASLTTYPARINAVHLTIESILNQTLKPDKIILWLAKDEFKDGEKQLPQELKELTKKGLTIKWCDKNFKSFNKLIHSLKEYHEDIIITFDDDIIYDKDCIKLLYEGYKKYPQYIQCHRALRIICKDKRILPYNDWVWSIKSKDTKPSFTNFFTACSGVLYPPHCLYKDVLDDKIFLKLCPREDDMWFWTMAVLNNTKINVVKNNIIKQVMNPLSSQEFALCNTNVSFGESTKQMENIMQHYSSIYNKILDNFVSKEIIKIFYIPILKIKRTNKKTKIYLFNFIPLYERKKNNKFIKYKIFQLTFLTINRL